MSLRASDFQRVFRKGGSATSTHLQVHVLDRDDGFPARVGIVVSRKHGGAVVRNRIRRRIKEVVRIMRLTNPGIDLVVVARRGIDLASYDQISTELNQIMEDRFGRGRAANG